MEWNKIEQIQKMVMDEIKGRTDNRPYTKHSGPLIGGLAPDDKDDEFIKPPAFITTKFTLQPLGKESSIIVSGNGMRQIREKLDADSSLKTVLMPITFDEKLFSLGAGRSTQYWHEDKKIMYEEGSKRIRLKDPGSTLSIEFFCEGKEEFEVSITIKNTNEDKKSIIYDFNFTIKLNQCKLIERVAKLDHPKDIPQIVETINVVAELDHNEIKLIPYGMWSQKRISTIAGPSFEESIIKPFDSINLGIYEKSFEFAARIATKAMKRIVNSSNYYKFQYDLRGIIYEQMVRSWNDGKFRSVIDNAPTASGKSEVNFDAAVVATLVRKKETLDGDCGTVAIIIEPIRALAAEQLERLFKFIAYVNEEVNDNDKITMGFFMGTQEGKGIPREPINGITLKQVPINSCPFCNNELELEYIQKMVRLIPKCNHCMKSFPWIYLTLSETKSFLPNIVVATLDKLCYDETRELDVHTFFGREYVRCSKMDCKRVVPVTSRVIKGEGTCRHCNSPVELAKSTKSMFSLLVIDEAHSFKGSIGSNSGLYTTAELQLSKMVLSQAPLVLASTATVKMANRLLKHLTGTSSEECIILPTDDVNKYFLEDPQNNHRKFIFLCPNVSNRVVIPRAVGAIKSAYDKIRAPDDPIHLPQIVFTKKRQNAENQSNAIMILNEVDMRNLKYDVIHGEHDKREVKEALLKVERNEIDVLFVTLDLISLGIDIPSISIVHFDGMPDDYAKFIQAYGRSARGKQNLDCGLIFMWLRSNIPGEAYFFEHFRDLFLYNKKLMPVMPINRWFPQSIRKYIPAAAYQFGFFSDNKASMFSHIYAARQLIDDDYNKKLQDFILNKVLSDFDDPEDEEIAKRYTILGIQDMRNHIQNLPLSTVRNYKILMDKIWPTGIRNQSTETLIVPTQFDRTLMSLRVEKSLLSAGFSEYEIGLGDN